MGKFRHALAPGGLAAPSSVLASALGIPREGANRDKFLKAEFMRFCADYEHLGSKVASGASDVDLSNYRRTYGSEQRRLTTWTPHPRRLNDMGGTSTTYEALC
jgi:hypothetical protein